MPHHATIEQDYVDGLVVWRVVCACGFKGEDRVTPRRAEHDLERHIRVEPEHI